MALTSNGFLSVFGTNVAHLFLRSNGTKVTCSELDEKIIAVYFAASSCVQCNHFTPILIEAYNDLISLKKSFEIILVSSDNDGESFQKHFSTAPWLALPHSNQTYYKFIFCKPIICHRENDCLFLKFLIQVPIFELEGKLVGLYVSLGSFRACQNFTPKLVDFYTSLKEKGESFEIVYVSLEDDKESFENGFVKMPWLAIPFGDKSLKKLPVYFKLNALPTLLILGSDGKNVSQCL